MTEEQKQEETQEVESTSFEDWVGELEEAEQPTCSIENLEDCEACGS